jgi:Tfp pilus assembly protein PilV
MARGELLGAHLMRTSLSSQHTGVAAGLADALELMHARTTGLAQDTAIRMARFWETNSAFAETAEKYFA